MIRLSLASPLLLLAWTLPVYAQEPDRYYGHHMMWGGGWLGMVFGFLMMLLFVGAIAVVVVLAVRWIGGQQGTGSRSKAALDILSERFARGEIDRAEFEERKRALED